ncbi:MAG: F0F1 ATP synthase subunit B [Gemmatimonadota bacterium]|nr:F0F1 ATP synthase subunit B [Gemmatimonadota bacterium]
MHFFLLQETVQNGAAEAPSGGLLSPNGGVMVWTLVIFIILLIVLSKYAFKPITKAVEDREQSLADAIEAAQRDREESGRLLQDQRDQIEGARDEAQRIIAEARAAAEQVRGKMIEQAHGETNDLLDRARREIVAERDRAVADLRLEAVDLAIAGASRVIGKNMDDQSNRQLVESFLQSVPESRIASKARA